MSNNEESNETVEGAKKALSGSLASVMALKNSNPKVFMGGAAALLLVFVLMLTMGGSDDKPVVAAVGGAPAKNLAIGQTYVLHSPNSYEDNATVQLVPVPGTIAAFDEAEDEVKNSCRKILQGTKVSIMNFQDAYGKKNNFAQVKVVEGPCKDKDGWVLAMDLQ